MNEISTKIRPALVSLEVGESMEFPIEKMKSVRTQASELGMILNRQFKTRTNRETQLWLHEFRRVNLSPMNVLEFSDRMIPYEEFANDLAARIANMIQSTHDDPEYISQNKAWRLFGRRNVERWRKEGKVEPCKRPGKLEYRTADLRLLQRTTQDYFKKVQVRTKQVRKQDKKD